MTRRIKKRHHQKHRKAPATSNFLDPYDGFGTQLFNAGKALLETFSPSQKDIYNIASELIGDAIEAVVSGEEDQKTTFAKQAFLVGATIGITAYAIYQYAKSADNFEIRPDFTVTNPINYDRQARAFGGRHS